MAATFATTAEHPPETWISSQASSVASDASSVVPFIEASASSELAPLTSEVPTATGSAGVSLSIRISSV